MDPLTSAIVGHLVGDYIIQTDWMALNKKKPGMDGLFPCVVHCVLWACSVMLFSGCWSIPLAALLFSTHLVQDGTSIVRDWMRLVGQEQFATGACSPWSIIVVDNVLHIVTIWLVWRFWL